MGLFMSKKELFEWQQIVAPTTPKLVMNKKQLQEASKLKADNEIKIIQDSVNLVNTTVNPDVFFKRLDLLQKKCYELTRLEPYVKFSGTPPSKSYQEIMEKEQNTIYDFIERYFYDAVEPKIKSLKTEDAKQRHYQKFYDSLEPYFNRMQSNVINYIKALCEILDSKSTDNDLSSRESSMESCSICGVALNERNMVPLYDGKICEKCYKKIGLQDTDTSASLKIASHRVKLYDDMKGDMSKIPPFPYTSMEDYKISLRANKYIYTPKYQKLEAKYHETRLNIDALWSILNNTKEYDGDNAAKCGALCLENIDIFKKIYYDYNIPYKTRGFDCVPAYTRLAMLYEKQKKYEDATLVCVDAINHGVVNEYGSGNSKKMYSRLARMAKKADMLDDERIKSLLDASKK